MLVKRKNFTRLNSKFNKRSKRSKRSKQNKINRKSRKNRKLKGGAGTIYTEPFFAKNDENDSGSLRASGPTSGGETEYTAVEPHFRKNTAASTASVASKFRRQPHVKTSSKTSQSVASVASVAKSGTRRKKVAKRRPIQKTGASGASVASESNTPRAPSRSPRGASKPSKQNTPRARSVAASSLGSLGANVARVAASGASGASGASVASESNTPRAPSRSPRGASKPSKQNTPRARSVAVAAKSYPEMFKMWKETYHHKYNDLFKLYKYEKFKGLAEKCRSPPLKSVEHRKQWLHNLSEHLKENKSSDRFNFVHACIETLTKNNAKNNDFPESYFIIFIRNRDIQKTKGITDKDSYTIGKLTYILPGSIGIYHKDSTNLTHIKTYKIGNTIDRTTTTDQSGLQCIWINKRRPWVMHGVDNPQNNLSDHINHLISENSIGETAIYIVVKK